MEKGMEFLPVSREEMIDRGWYYYDFLVVTADGYIDHPSFGTTLIASVFTRGGSEDLSNLSNRTIAWEAAGDMDRDGWQRWFGQGLAQKEISVPGQWWDTQMLDSTWVSALVQGGYLGLEGLSSCARRVRPVKRTRQDHGLRFQANMLCQHIAPRQQPLVQPCNAAKTKAQAMRPGLLCHAIQQPLRQRLEHETTAQRNMQVVEPHKHLAQAGRVYPVIH